MISDEALARLLVTAGLQLGAKVAQAIGDAIRGERPELLRDDPGALATDRARADAVARAGSNR